MILPVTPQIAFFRQQELPFEAFDAHPALLGRPFEAHGPQPPRNVAVHEAVTKVSIQRRLDVLIPPDVQQGPRLDVGPQEAPRRVGLHSGQKRVSGSSRSELMLTPWIIMDASLDPGRLSYARKTTTKLPNSAAWVDFWLDPPQLPWCK